MKLFIKQKVFTIGEEFTVKDEQGNDVFYVQGSFFRIPKKFTIYNTKREVVGTIESQLFRLFSHYDVTTNNDSLTVRQNFSFFRDNISIVNKDWTLQGDFLSHEYRVISGNRPIMSISKHWFTWGDSYMLDVEREEDAILSLAIVIIVDNIISKSRNNSAANSGN